LAHQQPRNPRLATSSVHPHSNNQHLAATSSAHQQQHSSQRPGASLDQQHKSQAVCSAHRQPHRSLLRVEGSLARQHSSQRREVDCSDHRRNSQPQEVDSSVSTRRSRRNRVWRRAFWAGARRRRCLDWGSRNGCSSLIHARKQSATNSRSCS